MKALAVSSLTADHPLPALLEAAGIARSTYFYHQARSGRPDRHAELKEAIHKAFTAAQGQVRTGAFTRFWSARAGSWLRRPC